MSVFRKPVKKIQVMWKSDRIMSTLRKDHCTFLNISRSNLLRMWNVSDKSCRENYNTLFLSTTFFFKLCHLWDNTEK